MKPPGSLSPLDQLTFMVGAVTRVDVAVEGGLRFVLRALEPSDAKPHPKMMDGLLRRTLKALPDWTDRPELLTVARGLLEEVESAHRERNRFVHDLMIREGPKFTRLDLSKITESTVGEVESLRQPFTLEDISAVWTRLKRCEWRMRSFEKLVGMDAPKVGGWTFQIVADQFDMTGRGTQITSSGYLYDDDVDALDDELAGD